MKQIDENGHQDETTSKPPVSLLEGFKALLASIPGAPERERILTLLMECQEFVLSDPYTQAISDTLAHESHTIERSLDFLHLPAPLCWFEWSEDARRHDTDLLHDGTLHPERVGVLLMHHQDDPDIIVGTTAWRLRDGSVDHAPSFVSWNMRDLASLSKNARFSYSKDNTECWSRMLSLIYTHVPQSFIEEMRALEDLRSDGEDIDGLVEAARRESSAEVLFIFGALLMTQTPRMVVEDGDKEVHLDLSMNKPSKITSYFLRPGFQRTRGRRKTFLKWNDVPVQPAA